MSDCRFGVSPVNYPDPDPDPGLYSALYSTTEYIEHPNVELCCRSSRSIFNFRMKSSIFGATALYSALYSNSECRDLYSALQVDIQDFIPHLNVEFFIYPSCLYSALYSTTECRVLKSIFSNIFKLRM